METRQILFAAEQIRLIAPNLARAPQGVFHFDGTPAIPNTAGLTFRRWGDFATTQYFAVIRNQDGREGVIDFAGNEMFWLEPGLEIQQVAYNLVLARRSDAWFDRAVFNLDGEVIIPFGQYDNIQQILGENRFLVQTNAEYWASTGVVNGRGQEIIPPERYGDLALMRGTEFLWIDPSGYGWNPTGVVDIHGRELFPRNRYNSIVHIDGTDMFIISDDRGAALVRVLL